MERIVMCVPVDLGREHGWKPKPGYEQTDCPVCGQRMWIGPYQRIVARRWPARCAVCVIEDAKARGISMDEFSASMRCLEHEDGGGK